MTMVERVADRIWKSHGWALGDDVDFADVLKIARAAIEAMREPTEAMAVAGEDVVAAPFVGGRLTDPSAVWSAMIDAAQKE